MTPDPISTTAKLPSADDRDYAGFLAIVQARFAAAVASGPLFTTDATDLFAAYLDAMPSERQYHTCHCCKRFLEVYGGLVVIDEAGRTKSALWADEGIPEFYAPVAAVLARLVNRASVTGVFLSSSPVWGTPVTGPWTHFAVTPPEACVYKKLLLTAGQAMAEKKEDYRNVCRALGEFSRPQLDQVMTLLESEALYRTEKVIGPARWLRDLHRARDAVRGQTRDHLTWRAIATAPAGFCHPRSSMIGTLLEDIAAGMDFAEVSRRFAARMHPLQYQRPQAAPSAGNIAAAEKVVEQLGVAGSLARRFARLEDVTERVWEPKPAGPTPALSGGVFSHLVPKGAGPSPSALVIPPVTMTWEKFARTVLPEAESMEFSVPYGLGPYVALTTAADPDSPPILQWDNPDRRNPVAWYVYTQGSPCGQWGLTAGTFCPVTAITFNPATWGATPGQAPVTHHGQSVVFLLQGCRDSLGEHSGAAIFPETLKSEFHGIRATIEAFSRRAKLEGLEEASACGVVLSKGNGTWNATFRVTKNGVASDYKLDRWD